MLAQFLERFDNEEDKKSFTLIYEKYENYLIKVSKTYLDDSSHMLKRFAFCLLLTQIFIFILLYAMTFLSGSITVPMLVIMVYFIVCQVVLINKSIPFVFTSVFDYSSGRELKTVFLPMLVSVPIMLLTGVIANKRYVKYN